MLNDHDFKSQSLKESTEELTTDLKKEFMMSQLFEEFRKEKGLVAPWVVDSYMKAVPCVLVNSRDDVGLVLVEEGS